MTMLTVSDLKFSFGNTQVLRALTFDVRLGEFMGIMGPNGSGKTTLLRCLTRYLPTEDGMVLVDAKPLNDFSPAEMARTFAVVPQVSVTDFPFTVYDIVMMGRIPHLGSRLAGETRTDIDIVQQAMARTNTLRFSGRIFSELSGGERQRVIIARAIAQRPKVLLLDEPTVYLDISGQIEIMDMIRKLNKEEGITVVAVLHDVNLAARYCDRIALLSDGLLEAVGPPPEVLTPDAIRSVYGGREEGPVHRGGLRDAQGIGPVGPPARDQGAPDLWRRHGRPADEGHARPWLQRLRRRDKRPG